MYLIDPIDFERDAERLFCIKKYPNMIFLMIEMSVQPEMSPIDILDRIESYEYLGLSRKRYRLLSITPVDVVKLEFLQMEDVRSIGDCQIENMETSFAKTRKGIASEQRVTLNINEHFLKHEMMNLTPKQLRTVQVLFGGSKDR